MDPLVNKTQQAIDRFRSAQLDAQQRLDDLTSRMQSSERMADSLHDLATAANAANSIEHRYRGSTVMAGPGLDMVASVADLYANHLEQSVPGIEAEVSMYGRLASQFQASLGGYVGSVAILGYGTKEEVAAFISFQRNYEFKKNRGQSAICNEALAPAVLAPPEIGKALDAFGQ